MFIVDSPSDNPYKDNAQKNNKNNVNFANGARAREFHKEKPPIDIQNISSIELADIKPAPQERKIPRIGKHDTIVGFGRGGVLISAHGSGQLFNDSEIVEKLDIIHRVEIKEEEKGFNVFAQYTTYGKAIIQQQATRGCTAATAAMLIMDNGKQPNLHQLMRRNLGTDDDQIRDIENTGLKAITQPANTLQELQGLLIENGSAIVAVNVKLGGHVIVVDEISEDLAKVRLRDPYHGWEITVTSKAFLKEWHGGNAIQVMND